MLIGKERYLEGTKKSFDLFLIYVIFNLGGFMKAKNLLGKVFGRLTVIERIENKNSRTQWKCRCECGNVHNVISKSLVNGSTKSCGCLRREIVMECNTTHGLSKTRLHKTWRGIIQRCNNKKNTRFKYYGGRGIIICDEWLNNFKSFYDWSIKNGYSDDLTIDRINNDGNYEPGNCRWITMLEQCHNRGLHPKNKSGCSGVTFAKDRNKWRASITINYKKINLGSFKNIDDAIIARKQAERKYWR